MAMKNSMKVGSAFWLESFHVSDDANSNPWLNVYSL